MPPTHTKSFAGVSIVLPDIMNIYDFDIFKQKHGKQTPEMVEKKYEAPLEQIFGKKNL